MSSTERSRSGSQASVIQAATFFNKICFWKKQKTSLEKAHRTVIPNHTVHEGTPTKLHPNSKFTNNKIRTTKYTLLSFIPKNLFEQFHRFANLYFLGIVLLNWVPLINAFGKEISMIPVLFVMGVTAIKDAFEDRRRYISDKRVNNYTCRVYSRSVNRYVKTLWKNVKVGDIVHLSCNEIIPADILMLRSSGDQGLCYIETSNLDGESNLKQRQVVRGFTAQNVSFHPTDFQSTVECDPPNNKIYRFNGYIVQKNGEKISVSKDNLLLRDCVLKNTDFVEGIVVYAGHETKAMLNNGGPRYKRSKLERFMNRDVIGCIVILVLLCTIGATGSGLWLDSYANKTLVPFIPFENSFRLNPVVEGFLSFLTYIIILQVMIPLSLYVTIEIIKLGQVYHIHQDHNLYDKKTKKHLECRALNIPEELGQVEYVFSDKTGTLTENRMIFQRCTVGGVDYNHHLPQIADIGPTINQQTINHQGENGVKNKYEFDPVFTLNPSLKDELSKLDMQLQPESGVTEVQFNLERQRLRDFFLLMAVCNTVVVSKYPHKDQMNSSGLYLNTLANTPNSHMGNGERNMTRSIYTRLENQTETPPHSATSTPTHRPHHLLLPSSRCSTPTPTPSPGELRPIYEAESPDEIALVDAAYRYNCSLLRRTPDSAVVIVPGEGLVEFRVLHVLPFDSVRKRMSVIIQHPITKERVLFCKGADSAIFTRLAPTTDPEIKNMILKTQQHLNSYSRSGLRILCMAKKVLSEEEYSEWLEKHKEAQLALDDRDQKLFDSADRIENNLELLGATGIEDRLQEGVPECIAALRAAGIVLWVLTGDKQETAVNIAYSCRLFSMDMEIITLNARSKEATEETIRFYLDQIQKDFETADARSSPTSVSTLPNSANVLGNFLPGNNHSAITRLRSQRRRKRALVVDGRTLAFVLERNLDTMFLDLAQHCSAVLCCRATPLQKAYVVKMVKDKLGVLTLAIGDGANDVSMIQTADVGVGISGQEGMQAVMASDFALPRFCFLERLLLVHGHWCYDRLARTVLYFFYKNASFIYIIFWYQLYCGFSGNVMIDQLYLMLFNVLFTALPPLMLGIYDQDCSANLLLGSPGLYARGRRSEIYTKYSFWFTMLDALYQSIVIFFVPVLVYYDSDVGIWEFGTTVLSGCVFVQLIHVSIETRSWTPLHGVSIVVSVMIYYLFAFVYNWLSVGTQSLQNPYMVIQHVVTTAYYWFSLGLICVLGCLPRLLIRCLQTTLCPSSVVKTLLVQKEQRRSSNKSVFSVSWSCQSSEASIIPSGVRNSNALHPDEPASVSSNSGSVQNA